LVSTILTIFSKVGGEVIDVIAGSGATEKIFHVHKAMLESVAFFRNAMKTEWTNGDTKKPIDLSNQDPVTVEIYLNWIYFRHIPETDDYLLLCRLYVLGNELIHDQFQNAVLDTIIETVVRIKKLSGSPAVHLIYDGTDEGSPARRLFVDMYLWSIKEPSYMHECFDDYPSEFLRDYMCALIRLKKRVSLGKKPWITRKESYHLGIEGSDSEHDAY
jgi:hypothetical protein